MAYQTGIFYSRDLKKTCNLKYCEKYFKIYLIISVEHFWMFVRILAMSVTGEKWNLFEIYFLRVYNTQLLLKYSQTSNNVHLCSKFCFVPNFLVSQPATDHQKVWSRDHYISWIISRKRHYNLCVLDSLIMRIINFSGFFQFHLFDVSKGIFC